MKLLAPKGVSTFVHGGQSMTVAKDGSMEADEETAAVLLSHGFRPWRAKAEAIGIDSMSRSEMILYVLERTRLTLDALPTEELRARLRLEKPDTVILPDEAAGKMGLDGADIADSDIEKMGRIALFAFLKSRGVIARPPITNDELRAMARESMRPEESAAEGQTGE